MRAPYGHPLVRQSIQTLGSVQTCTWRQMGDHPNIQGASKHMGVSQAYRGYPNIWGHPNIQGVSKHKEKHMGHPSIQGTIQTFGASKCMGAYRHPLSLTKHAFFVLVYLQEASTHMGAKPFLYNPELYLPSIEFLTILKFCTSSFFFNFKYFIHFSKYSLEFCTVC